MLGVKGVGQILGTCMQTDMNFVTTHYKARVQQACPGGIAADLDKYCNCQ